MYLICANPKCGKKFRLRPPSSRNRRYCYRKTCEERRVWREQNSERYAFLRKRWIRLSGKKYSRKWRLAFYGLTEKLFRKLRKAQKNRCAICRRKFKAVPHIDHKLGAKGTHRGLLCINCNTLIGQAQENIGVLLRAVAYLRRHR